MLDREAGLRGRHCTDTLAAVLRREPDWTALPARRPAAMRGSCGAACTRTRDQRLRDVGDARLELEGLRREPAGPTDRTDGAAAIARRPRTAWPELIRSRLLWFMVGTVAAAVLWAFGTSRPLAERPVVRLAISLPSPETVEDSYAPAVALSPDGTQLAYVAARPGGSQIYLRTLNRLEARPIPGTEGGNGPFFSPDGRWLGFFVEREHKLKRVPLSGGAPLTLCDAAHARGASWGPDSTIVFARDGISGLHRLSAGGGTPQVLTTLDASRREGSHRLPKYFRAAKASSSRSRPTRRSPGTTHASKPSLSERASDPS